MTLLGSLRPSPTTLGYQDVSLTEKRLLADGDSDQDSASGEPSRFRRQRLTSFVPLVLNLGLLVLNVLFLALAYTANGTMSERNAVLKTSAYSPVLNSWYPGLHATKINGSGYPPAHPSAARREPGDPLGEPFWEYFEWPRPVVLSSDDLIRMGKDPAMSVQLPDQQFGHGEDAYAGILDVTHKMHCLNELRKMTFKDYPFAEGSVPFDSEKAHEASYHKSQHSSLWWYHLRHCVDLLAQDIMCHADTEIYTFNWRDTQVHAYADFAIQRQCRDFEGVLKWGDENSVDFDEFRNVTNPFDVKKMVTHEKEYYEIYGFEGSLLYPDGKGFEEYWEKHWGVDD